MLLHAAASGRVKSLILVFAVRLWGSASSGPDREQSLGKRQTGPLMIVD